MADCGSVRIHRMRLNTTYIIMIVTAEQVQLEGKREVQLDEDGKVSVEVRDPGFRSGDYC